MISVNLNELGGLFEQRTNLRNQIENLKINERDMMKE
jgi:hypothetical protein